LELAEPVKIGKDDVAGLAGAAARDCVAAGATGVASLTPGTSTGDSLTTGVTAGAPLVSGRLPLARLLAPMLIALVLSVVGGGTNAAIVDETGVVKVDGKSNNRLAWTKINQRRLTSYSESSRSCYSEGLRVDDKSC
jgi:hypothetical protein